MANIISSTTTIKPTTLSVNINEQISVNGVQYGNTTIKAVNDCGKVDQRVMATYSNAYTSFFDWKTEDSAGQGVQSQFSYFRVTNTDSLLGVTISFDDSGGKTQYIYLVPGASYVLFNPLMSSATTGGEIPALAKLSKVKAICDTPANPTKDAVYEVYIEYVAVFQGGYTANDDSDATSQ